MKKSTGFLMGIGTGLMAGAAAALMLPERSHMNTAVGRGIQKMGTAVDHAVDNVVREVHDLG